MVTIMHAYEKLFIQKGRKNIVERLAAYNYLRAITFRHMEKKYKREKEINKATSTEI